MVRQQNYNNYYDNHNVLIKKILSTIIFYHTTVKSAIP